MKRKYEEETGSSTAANTVAEDFPSEELPSEELTEDPSELLSAAEIKEVFSEERHITLEQRVFEIDGMLDDDQKNHSLFQAIRYYLLWPKELQTSLVTAGFSTDLVPICIHYLPYFPDTVRKVMMCMLIFALKKKDLDAITSLFLLEEKQEVKMDFKGLGVSLIVKILRDAIALTDRDEDPCDVSIYEKISDRFMTSSIDLRARDYQGYTLFTIKEFYTRQDYNNYFPDLWSKLVAKLCNDLKISDVIFIDPQKLREIIGLKKHHAYDEVLNKAFFISSDEHHLRVWLKTKGGSRTLTIPCNALPDFFPWQKYKALEAIFIETIKAIAIRDLRLKADAIYTIECIDHDGYDGFGNERLHVSINGTPGYFISPTENCKSLFIQILWLFHPFDYEMALAEARGKGADLRNPLPTSEQGLCGKFTLPMIKLLLACNRDTETLTTEFEIYNGVLACEVSLLTCAMVENKRQTYDVLRSQGKKHLVSDLPVMVSCAIRSRPSTSRKNQKPPEGGAGSCQDPLDALFITNYLKDMRESDPSVLRPHLAMALEEAAYDKNFALLYQLLEAGIAIGRDTPLAAKFVLCHSNNASTFKAEIFSAAVCAIGDVSEKLRSDQWINFFKLQHNDNTVAQKQGHKRSICTYYSQKNKDDTVKKLKRICVESARERTILDSNREMYSLYQAIAPMLSEVLSCEMTTSSLPIFLILGFLLQREDFLQPGVGAESKYEDNFVWRLFNKIRPPASDREACAWQLRANLNNSFRGFLLLQDKADRKDRLPVIESLDCSEGKLIFSFRTKAPGFLQPPELYKGFQSFLRNKYDIRVMLNAEENQVILTACELSKFLLQFAPELDTTLLFGTLPETMTFALCSIS